jgi:parallel beta-helix repeat protein
MIQQINISNYYQIMTGKIYNYRIFIVALLFILSASTVLATNYHVSPLGSDTANGSEDTPFKTIAKAASMVMPGDTVFVAEGTYIERNITPKSSGTENAIIVFKAIPGTSGVIVKHPGTSIDDDTPVFQLSNRDFIWIEGFQFKDFQFGRASIYISSGQGNVVINNRFENLGNGEVGKWNGNQMVGLFNSSRNVVTNNYFENITGDGINVNSQGSEYNLISNNTFMNFKGKLRSWGGQYLFSRAIDVQDMSNGNNVIAFNNAENVIHHIWLDRDGSNNIVLRNIGRKGSGLVFNESRCANNVIQENISMEMKVGYMTAYYETTGWTFDPRWVNNVAYNNQTGFSIHKSMRDEFRNNIAFNNTDFNLKFTAEALSNAPHVFRNNLWYSTNKTNSIEFKGTAVSVAGFQAAIGETNGLSEDPLFTSIVSGAEDFTLKAGSPAKGAADNGLDMGAFAFYPMDTAGWNPDIETTGILVYFGQVVSASNRGEQVQLVLKLNKASTETINADIVPVAGDALSGKDFEFLNTTLVFQPGETTKTVSVDITGESDFDELVAFRIDNVTNAIPGARNLHLLRINKTLSLKANAGINQTAWEISNTGAAEVVLDGSLSYSPFGTIASFVWDIEGTEIAAGETTTATLPLGTHTITLTVTDDEGNTATDEVIVTVTKVSGVWLEAECGDVGSLWNIESDEAASNGRYVTIKPGNNSTDNAPTGASGLLTYTFNISESGNYTLYLRVICPDPNADSFWLKMNDGAFASWNNIGPSSSWQWFAYPNAYNLSEGSHNLTIAYREDEAKLDKLWITNSGTTPEDEGPAAGNCETSAINYELNATVNVFPNPVNDKLTIEQSGSLVNISIYDTNGQLLYHKNVNAASTTIDMAHFKQGIYFLKIAGQNETIVKKLIKQ